MLSASVGLGTHRAAVCRQMQWGTFLSLLLESRSITEFGEQAFSVLFMKSLFPGKSHHVGG